MKYVKIKNLNYDYQHYIEVSKLNYIWKQLLSQYKGN